MASLVEKLHAIHDGLTEAHLQHAFGGAIALAYCTLEPRGTRDLDVNIFVPVDRVGDVAAALPEGVAYSDDDLARIRESGQTRLWWDDTPVDVFLNNVPYHEVVAADVRWVPLAGREVPVLSCSALVVFKALFNRTKDWADIEAVAEADPASVVVARDAVAGLIGDRDEIVARLGGLAGG
jgi:hypothetical protein